MPALPARRSSSGGAGSGARPSAATPAAAASPAATRGGTGGAAAATTKPTAALWLDQGGFLIVTLFQVLICCSKHGSGAGPAAVLLLMAACTAFVFARPAAYWPNRWVVFLAWGLRADRRQRRMQAGQPGACRTRVWAAWARYVPGRAARLLPPADARSDPAPCCAGRGCSRCCA